MPSAVAFFTGRAVVVSSTVWSDVRVATGHASEEFVGSDRHEPRRSRRA